MDARDGRPSGSVANPSILKIPEAGKSADDYEMPAPGVNLVPKS